MKKKNLLYFGGKIGGIATVVVLSFMLLSGCACERSNPSAASGSSVGVSKADGATGSSSGTSPTQNQGSSAQADGMTQGSSLTNGSAGSSAQPDATASGSQGGSASIPAADLPNAQEKAAIMKKYGISEELYEEDLNAWKYSKGWKSFTLDEFVGMMEEQRKNPAP